MKISFIFVFSSLLIWANEGQPDQALSKQDPGVNLKTNKTGQEPEKPIVLKPDFHTEVREILKGAASVAMELTLKKVV